MGVGTFRVPFLIRFIPLQYKLMHVKGRREDSRLFFSSFNNFSTFRHEEKSANKISGGGGANVPLYPYISAPTYNRKVRPKPQPTRPSRGLSRALYASMNLINRILKVFFSPTATRVSDSASFCLSPYRRRNFSPLPPGVGVGDALS